MIRLDDVSACIYNVLRISLYLVVFSVGLILSILTRPTEARKVLFGEEIHRMDVAFERVNDS